MSLVADILKMTPKQREELRTETLERIKQLQRQKSRARLQIGAARRELADRKAGATPRKMFHPGPGRLEHIADNLAYENTVLQLAGLDDARLNKIIEREKQLAGSRRERTVGAERTFGEPSAWDKELGQYDRDMQRDGVDSQERNRLVQLYAKFNGDDISR